MLEILILFEEDESGAAAVEYGLIVALVSLAGIVALSAAGEAIDLLLNLVVEAVLPPD
jgi:Flp pilus assembly pilin Flp